MKNNVDAICYLTPLQQGMLHHSRQEAGSGLYVEQFSCRLHGPLQLAHFRAAWHAVVQRHDALKALFVRLHQAQPLQVIRKEVALPFKIEDWQHLDEVEQNRLFDFMLREDRRNGFDPGRAPLLRLLLISLGDDRHRFLWTYHHAILDGWSMPVILGEVFRVYAMLCNGVSPMLPKPLPYRQYVAWLRNQNGDAARAFWRDNLHGYRQPLRFAPTCRPAVDEGAVDERAVAGRVSLNANLPAPWREQAQALCRSGRITLNTLCQGAWSLLLSCYADQDDLVYGTVVAGRPLELAGIETCVGLFINTLPLRVQIDRNQTLLAWLQTLQSANQTIEQHGHPGLAQILQCSELPRDQPLFDCLYVFENYPGQAALTQATGALGLTIDDVRAVEETNYGLALILVPADGLQIQLTCDRQQFSTAAMTRLLADYQRVLQVCTDALQSPAARIPVSLLPAFVQTAADARLQQHSQESRQPHTQPHLQEHPEEHPEAVADDSLLARLAQQIRCHPDRIALHDGAQTLSYGQLGDLLAAATATWQRLPFSAGQQVWVTLTDPLQQLAALLAAMALGLRPLHWESALQPEPALPPARLLAAISGVLCGPGAAAAVSDKLATLAPVAIPVTEFALPVTEFTPAPAALAATPFAPPLNELLTAPAPAGRLLLGGCNALGECQIAGYQDLQLGRAAAATDAWYPQCDAWDLPWLASGSGNLVDALLGLANGFSLHRIATGSVQSDLLALAGANGPWHRVRLDDVQTRHWLSADAPELPTHHLVLDATALASAQLDEYAGHGRESSLHKELRIPAQGLPCALACLTDFASAAEFLHSVGTTAPGSDLWLLDRQLQPVAAGCFGSLYLGGATVPLEWDTASPLHLLPSPLPALRGQLLSSGIPAWHSGNLPQADWQQADALGAPDTDLLALEQHIRQSPLIEDIALLQQYNRQGHWQIRACLASSATDQQLQALFAAAGATTVRLERLQSVPRNADGIDRRALWNGDFQRAQPGHYQPPRDDTERRLQAIWHEVLQRQPIGIDDNYFDLGGQSLLATVMLYQIEEQFDQRIDVEALLAYPTIAGLAAILRGELTALAPAAQDLAADAILDDDIIPAQPFDPERFEANAILLTGATGFLGVHLLGDLLEQTSADIYCLVRADNVAAGLARLVGALKKNQRWQDRFGTRLLAIPGTLDQPQLGLVDARFQSLAQTIDVIYHNGAQVNFVYPYSSLKQANVLATRDLLRLACSEKTKPLHYISTVGVLDRTLDSIPEQLQVSLHPFLLGGYEQGKWVAEQLVCSAAARGLPVAIYRPSRIVGHSVTGQLNSDDLFSRLIKGVIEFGRAPLDTGFDNMVPVDVASRTIVAVSLQSAAYGRAFHIINRHWNSLDSVVDAIEAEGFTLERLDYTGWVDALEQHVRSHRDNPLAMLIPVLKRLNPLLDASLARQMPIATGNVSAVLAASVGESSPLDSIADTAQLLKVFFRHFYQAGELQAVNAEMQSG